MSQKPLISVITPTYNCSQYINDCIKSVLAQNYDNFEHIIVDGASTDGTVEILKQYPHLKWISEPDNGEGEALNKALKLAQGDIIGWLNADDYYLEGVFDRVIQEMNPQKGCHVVYGNADLIDEKGKVMYEKRSAKVMTLPFLLRWWEYARHPHQPSIFYSKEVFSKGGAFKQELHFSIDYEHWIRTVVNFSFTHVDKILSVARIRTDSKSINTVPQQIESHWRVSLPYHKYLSLGERIEFWKDYVVYKAQQTIQTIRIKLGLGKRLRNFKGLVLKFLG